MTRRTCFFPEMIVQLDLWMNNKLDVELATAVLPRSDTLPAPAIQLHLAYGVCLWRSFYLQRVCRRDLACFMLLNLYGLLRFCPLTLVDQNDGTNHHKVCEYYKCTESVVEKSSPGGHSAGSSEKKLKGAGGDWYRVNTELKQRCPIFMRSWPDWNRSATD